MDWTQTRVESVWHLRDLDCMRQQFEETSSWQRVEKGNWVNEEGMFVISLYLSPWPRHAVRLTTGHVNEG